MSDERFNQQRFEQGVIHAQPSELATNRVLRNTYMLLGMTLVFSGICAYVAYALNFSLINPWIFLAGVIGFQFLIHMTANSSLGIACTFLFTGFMGFTAGPFLNLVINTLSTGPQLVALAAGGTGMIFFGLSGYILTTRKEMSFLSSALVTGSFVALLALVVSLVFNIPALHLAVCVLFMLIASGMILYQTSAIVHGGQTNYVMATVTLYLSIYNLFMTMLQLLVAFMGDR